MEESFWNKKLLVSKKKKERNTKLLLWRLALGFGPIVSFGKILPNSPHKKLKKTNNKAKSFWVCPYGLCNSFYFQFRNYWVWFGFRIRFHFSNWSISRVLLISLWVLFRLKSSKLGSSIFVAFILSLMKIEDWNGVCLVTLIIQV